jgi:PII-like signaling protein
MKPGDKAKRLRIYVSSTDKFRHTPLYEEIVFAAKKSGIAGATVLKGIMGYGASSEIYTGKLWELSEKMPLVVEIIDSPEKIDSFFDSIKPLFEKIGKGHMITVDETVILVHKAGIIKQSENT